MREFKELNPVTGDNGAMDIISEAESAPVSDLPEGAIEVDMQQVIKVLATRVQRIRYLMDNTTYAKSKRPADRKMVSALRVYRSDVMANVAAMKTLNDTSTSMVYGEYLNKMQGLANNLKNLYEQFDVTSLEVPEHIAILSKKDTNGKFHEEYFR